MWNSNPTEERRYFGPIEPKALDPAALINIVKNFEFELKSELVYGGVEAGD
ncbi:hypothetical protein LMG22037_06537 [Paraburkholderia phenoliruptrix]|uniref:Uncharacterized protein n=1 Tax=Paraburkholderia phenoliruptrix TaxID=252970 RepID=A0A6J5CPS6_9BURK|nr:hypothetical protein [Paraburkholderia phenoliruptrix]CAB3741867.1 hypothetical protein LMG22037_06537 [Paraburkholderia phenoliruptrix]